MTDVAVTMFGATFQATEITLNGDGTWLMQTLENTSRGPIGTMIIVAPSEIAGYVSPTPPYFEVHAHSGVQAGGARSGPPKAVGT